MTFNENINKGIYSWDFFFLIYKKFLKTVITED